MLLLVSFSGCKKSYKYNPETKSELKELVDNSSISLGDINTSKITDMSELFLDSKRDNFTGIDNWDVSNVMNMMEMFYDAASFNQDLNSWQVGAWLENSNYYYDTMKVDNAFIGSPLENNPPYWYINYKVYNESYDEEYDG